MKKLIMIALAVTMAFGATACSSSITSSSDVSMQTGTIETSATTEETTVEPTTEPQSEAVGPGNYIEKEDLKISFLSAKQYDEIQDPDNEYLKSTPSEGKKYLVLFFEVENLSSEDKNVNIFYQKAYLDDYETKSTVLLTKPDDFGMLSGDLAPGKKLKGCVAYEVNPDWQKLEFTYTDGVSSESSTYNFVVTPDQLS